MIGIGTVAALSAARLRRARSASAASSTSPHSDVAAPPSEWTLHAQPARSVRPGVASSVTGAGGAVGPDVLVPATAVVALATGRHTGAGTAGDSGGSSPTLRGSAAGSVTRNARPSSSKRTLVPAASRPPAPNAGAAAAHAK